MEEKDKSRIKQGEELFCDKISMKGSATDLQGTLSKWSACGEMALVFISTSESSLI